MASPPTNRLLNLLRLNARRGEFRAETNTIYLYDTIVGDELEAEMFGGVTAKQFNGALNAMTGPVTLRVNSPGGDVFAAWSMAQAMREHQVKHGPITAIVEGVAASAASIVAVTAQNVTMAKSSMMMIHKAWSLAVGNTDDFAATSQLLAKIDGMLAQAYADRSGRKPADFEPLMAAETWFTPDEAIAAGLADGIAGEDVPAVQARWDLSVYGREAAAPPPERQIKDRSQFEDFLRRHGFAKAAARKITAGGWPALAQPEIPEPIPQGATKLLARLDDALYFMRSHHD